MTTTQKLIQPKIGLLKLAEKLSNVSEAYKVMGYSRDNFTISRSFVKTVANWPLKRSTAVKLSLRTESPSQMNMQWRSMPSKHPEQGQARTCNELKKRGVSVSAAGIRCVWLRHDLETMQKRLKAMETKVAQKCLILTLTIQLIINHLKGTAQIGDEEGLIVSVFPT